MPVLRSGILVVCMLSLCGCRPCGWLIKRESETDCPTDIRQTVPWCVGEDAIFHCPCGPDENYYGYKPTCWGVWPASGAEWRDSRCGPPITGCTGSAESYPPAELPMPTPAPMTRVERRTLPPGNARLDRATDSTLPGLPFPDAPQGGSWPAQHTGAIIAPKATPPVIEPPASSQPPEITFSRPQPEESPPPPTQWSDDQTTGDEPGPMLPERLIVFQQEVAATP